MKRKIKYCLVCLLLVLSVMHSAAQDSLRVANIEQKLKSLVKTNPGLAEKVDYSLSGSSVQDLITGLATMHSLNVTVDPGINIKVNQNFSNVSVSEVFLFLCKQYNIDIAFTGSIMSFSNLPPAPAEVKKVVPKELKISFNKTDNTVSFDLKNDTLLAVCKEITRLTGKNIVIAPEITYKSITSYIQALPLNEALDKMAFGNDLKITSTDKNNSFIIDKEEKEAKNAKNNSGTSGSNGGTTPNSLSINMDSPDKVTLNAMNSPISEILSTVTNKMNKSYYLFTELKGNISLSVQNADYDQFLTKLFNGTDYTFKKDSGTYLIGTRKLEGLRATKMYAFKYRTTDKVLDIIPGELKKDVELYIYPEQNAIIMSGSQPRIEEIYALLLNIDKVVPVISIDVIIFDVTDQRNVSTGLTAGLGKSPANPSTGGIDPKTGLTLNIGSNALNELIAGINGISSLNLGFLTPNFYLNLIALESKSYLKIRSTPKIATLNGNEAKLSIGKTEYYSETTTTLQGSVTTTSQSQTVYKPLTADLSVTITPVISADEHVTLDIKVKTSSFTQRVGTNGPFGSINRDFSSKIRVKNSETIILGGLEEYEDGQTSSGVPFLAKIPVIKWFFSSRIKNKKKNKLVILVKPTVIY